MKKYILLIFISLFIFCSTNNKKNTAAICNQNNKIANPSKKVKTKQFEIYNNKVKILVKDSLLKNYYSIDSNSISIFNDDTKKEILFKIYFTEVNTFLNLFNNYSDTSIIKILKDKNINKFDISQIEQKNIENYIENNDKTNKKLSGKKIAIDPGHFAGNFDEGIFEGKAFKINDKNIYEAKLNFSTAIFLKDTLEKLGATVLLTIEKHGNTSFNKTFDDWIKDDINFYLTQELEIENISQNLYNELIIKPSKQIIFNKFFKNLEIRERANKINKFKPDVSIIIHYDIDYENWEKNVDKKVSPSKQSFSTTFISGAFCKNDLSTNLAKLHFLRLILDSTYEKSLILANCIISSIATLNNININKNIDDFPWGKSAKYSDYEGVYSRNLGLTRLINSPLCYCEGFYQDNEYEYQQLTNETIKIYDIYASKRTQEIAYSYLNGVLKYFENE